MTAVSTDILQEIQVGGLLAIAAIAGIAVGLTLLVQRYGPRLAEQVPGRYRLSVLALVPLLRLLIIAAALVLIIPQLIEPTFENLVAVLGAVGLALGFALKDYVSSLIAGIVVIYEGAYRPGDWVEVEGEYGEVRAVGMRAMEMVTPDDTVIVVPHQALWTGLIHNANDGTQNLQCVADFYLDPEHDGRPVRRLLRDIALTSPYLQIERPIDVVAAERPWGTHYRLKAYPVDPRDQFRFTTDLTVRGKAALREADVSPARARGFAE
ncbi:mechanosensitive ion channel family protein [Salinibacter ruber]|uniref:mechanosensitive ion channel family protein n=1 Tax=Salinibacter ruber TaxID=146919 RepID=UPI0021693087|nr:mechanosensitive ion channel family protein [Salinibacter ruber]MCS3702498.1 small-conductance mechanosensitive channel [Salinibacter ruber]